MDHVKHKDSKLFQPLKLGRNVQTQHRIVMAPMTRARASANHVPLPIVREYFSQRSQIPGSFVLPEGTLITPKAGFYKNELGIYDREHISAWKEITAAVHANGSFIYCQLMTLGRAIDPNISQKGSMGLISSSATPVKEGGEVPREMTVEEIHEFQELYVQAARNAIEAGFDGVEIHAANGYLIDQFLQDTCNRRADQYGGSIENRSRFALEIARKVCQAVGSDRTGIRLSPFGFWYGMRMKDPIPQFTHLVKNLRGLNLAYLHLIESLDPNDPGDLDFLVRAWDSASPIIFAGGYEPDLALKKVERYKDQDVAVAFARYFMSNPDLVFRLKHGIQFKQWDEAYFLNTGAREGYLDYPFSEEFMKTDRKRT